MIADGSRRGNPLIFVVEYVQTVSAPYRLSRKPGGHR